MDCCARLRSNCPTSISLPFTPGNDPETGESITVRIGRNYVFVQRGEGGEGNSGTVPVDVLIDELTIDKARRSCRLAPGE